jgi:hypothetical protein
LQPAPAATADIEKTLVGRGAWTERSVFVFGRRMIAYFEILEFGNFMYARTLTP